MFNKTARQPLISSHLRNSSTYSTISNACDSRQPPARQPLNVVQDEKSDAERRDGLPNSNPHKMDGMYPASRTGVIAAQRFRRSFFMVFVLLGLMYWSWEWYLRPQWELGLENSDGFIKSEETFEPAKGGHFDGVRIQDLDRSLIPGGDDDADGERRLVFVGDVHGCAHELKKLLKKVSFNNERDHLIAVGDVISKGPDNVKVLDELIRLNATSVRGNHEDRILSMLPSTWDATFEPSSVDIAGKETTKDAHLIKHLSKRHFRYLKHMPLMLRIPPLPLVTKSIHKDKSPIGEEILVVHAGLVPGVALKKQDPYFVMNMRAIKTKTHKPLAEAATKKGKSKPWHDFWCWYNDRLVKHKSLKDFEVAEDAVSEEDGSDGWLDGLDPSIMKKHPDPQVVIYGHRSKEGLKIERWTKGLDTGCVKGGKLTALVLDAKGRQEIVHVKCKDYS